MVRNVSNAKAPEQKLSERNSKMAKISFRISVNEASQARKVKWAPEKWASEQKTTWNEISKWSRRSNEN